MLYDAWLLYDAICCITPRWCCTAWLLQDIIQHNSYTMLNVCWNPLFRGGQYCAKSLHNTLCTVCPVHLCIENELTLLLTEILQIHLLIDRKSVKIWIFHSEGGCMVTHTTWKFQLIVCCLSTVFFGGRDKRGRERARLLQFCMIPYSISTLCCAGRMFSGNTEKYYLSHVHINV